MVEAKIGEHVAAGLDAADIAHAGICFLHGFAPINL